MDRNSPVGLQHLLSELKQNNSRTREKKVNTEKSRRDKGRILRRLEQLREENHLRI